MRELDRIRHALAAAAVRKESVVLCTVMRVEGSVYRGAGARMVVTAGAETVGAVSGGCLEADIVARAPEVLASERAEVVRYDTRASDDVVLGLGLGCQGIIDVLLEPLAGATLDDAIAFYERLAARREVVTLMTLLRASDEGLAVGTRLVVDENGNVVDGEERLLSSPDELAREIVRPMTPLVVCGAGTDAIPLVRLAKLMGWHVTVIDHRASFVTRDRFPDADMLICANLSADASSLATRIVLDERTMAVVMAHAATHDRAYLHAMLDAGASYIGVLGPRRRTMELLGDRAVDGELPPAVHAPIGLDLGAESPDEIALAIVAEIAAVNAGRSGGLLRDRSGPIHDRENSLHDTRIS
jgi:xanthine dehydrogenase accessory factor